MAARSRCGHYIFVLWFLLSSFYFLFSSPNLSRRRLDLRYFHTSCGLSPNLECMPELCCTRLAENAGRKNRHCTTLSGYVFAKARYRQIGKKLVKHQHPHNMANFGPLTAEIGSGVYGTTANFNRFRVLPSILQRRRSTHRRTPKLCTMFGHFLGWYYTFSGALAL